MNLAPIALFVYNRPDTTLLCLQHLKRNRLADRSVLYIFSDGPKPGAGDGDLQAVREVRKIIRTESWCREVYIEESPVNLGLSRSIIGGVTRLVQQFGKIIVLEDDLLTSAGFLEFMNGGLERYADEERVFQVNGYLPPVLKNYTGTSFFLPMASTWGWATWERAWRYFEVSPANYRDVLSSSRNRKKFDLNNSFPYTDMLFRQMRGEIDSWGIRWWYTVYQQNGICLFPDRTLIKNIGFNEFATHTKSTSQKLTLNWTENYRILEFPDLIKINVKYFNKIVKFNRIEYRKYYSPIKKFYKLLYLKVIIQFYNKVYRTVFRMI